MKLSILEKLKKLLGIKSLNDIEHSSVLFWNVDTQNDFMMANGKLYVQDAEQIIPVLTQLSAFAEKYNIRVVNSCDYHNEETLELSDTPDFINTFPYHCMKGTKGQKFIKETQPKDAVIFDWDIDYTEKQVKEVIRSKRNIVIRKDYFDVFFNNLNADTILKVLSPKNVFVYGVATNVCVNYAVVGLIKRGFNVYVIEDAIKGLPNIPTPIEQWKSLGCKLIPLKDVETYL